MLASTQGLLQGSKEEAHKFQVLHAESTAALSMAKSGVDSLLASYQKDAAVANAQAREISKETELKMAHALEHSQLEAQRKAFKEVHTKGSYLSAEVEEAKTLKEESVALTFFGRGLEE